MASAQVRLWDFVDALDKASTLDEIRAIFLSETSWLGFAYAGLVSLGDPFNPSPRGVSIHRGHDGWSAHYRAEGYYRNDPLQREARRRISPELRREAFRPPWDPPLPFRCCPSSGAEPSPG